MGEGRGGGAGGGVFSVEDLYGAPVGSEMESMNKRRCNERRWSEKEQTVVPQWREAAPALLLSLPGGSL